jgi:anti-sigma B factor antagonist
LNQHRRLSLREHLRPSDAATVIAAAGELDLGEVGELRERILRAFDSGAVVLDLSAVSFCDSAGLRTLLEVHHAALNRAASFRIASPSSAVTRVLELAGVDAVVPFDSEPDSAREP